MSNFLEIQSGDAPLVVGLPHTGTDIPADIEGGFVSPWLARRDADWWVDQLYAFAAETGATLVRTRISRSVIDVNRDPSGVSLYPGMATTELCPTTTFDGEPLYAGETPNAAEIERRRTTYFEPYHAALKGEIDRLRASHGKVVLYDAHSIRSVVPRLFDGQLPQFNIGTNGGVTSDPMLSDAISAICEESGHSTVVDGRFRGGWTTRHYGCPAEGVHAIQMELAMRGYLDEPATANETNWPPPLAAEPTIQPVLQRIIAACLDFAGAKA